MNCKWQCVIVAALSLLVGSLRSWVRQDGGLEAVGGEVQQRHSVAPGSNLRWEFEIRSGASTPTEISSWVASCKCLSVDVSSRILLPGRSVKLLVTTKMPEVGALEGAVRVHASDGATVLLRFVASAFHETRLHVAPSKLIVRRDEPGGLRHIAIRFESRDPMQEEPSLSVEGHHVRLEKRTPWLQVDERSWSCEVWAFVPSPEHWNSSSMNVEIRSGDVSASMDVVAQ